MNTGDLIQRTVVIAACFATTGCRGVNTPTAVVVPQIAAMATPTQSTIESATLTYVRSAQPAASPVDEIVVAPASFTVGASDANPTATKTPSGPMRVLAIRYPHPDGRHDVARAELISIDSAHELGQSSSWRSRIARAIDAHLPGVEWGPGIRQAKGLDVPLAELRQILEPAAASTGTPVPAEQSLAGVRLEVNGLHSALPTASGSALDGLGARVASEGRIISYPGSATELLAIVGTPN